MAISAGQVIGQYLIRQKIGQGGMGAVYQAEQTAVRRAVVLKVLSANIADDPAALERFRREADIIARLEHPHILPVYDFGEVDGSPYIVMRYMGGGSLLDRLAAHDFAREQLLRTLDQVAEALDYAHDRDVIHRDLKPGNVLLDERGNAYLADFGLAKTMEGSGDLTATGSILGTPAYMSPEQARGEKLDPRSDVYAFAVLTYQALSGRLPFVAGTPWDYIQKHLVEPPPPILAIAPDLPLAVDEVLAAALAKDREQRPTRATEFMKALRAALSETSAPVGAAAPFPPAGGESRGGRGAARTVTPGPTAGVTAPARLRTTTAIPAERPRHTALWALPAAVVALGGGALILAVVAAAAFFALRGNPLAPAVSTYPVGNSPRALLFDGQSVWVANFFDNTVTRLQAVGCDASPDPCGQALGTYAVDDLPVGLAYDGQWLWVASAFKGTLTQLEPKAGATLNQYRLPNVPSTLLLADGFLWTANAFAGTVTKVGLDGKIVGDYPVGNSPVALSYDGQSLWVANQTDAALAQVDPASGRVTATVNLGGQPTALAFDGQHVWAAIGDGGEVVEIDSVSRQVLNRVAVGGRPTAVLFDDRSIWSADQENNAVTRIDTTKAERLSTIPIGGGPYALAWAPCAGSAPGCGDLWIASEANDTVSRVQIR